MSYELDFERPLNGGTQKMYKFSNGYAASVISSPYSYGGDIGQWELAVKHGGTCVYDTPVTDDVEGYLLWPEVERLLEQIDQLPER